MAEEAFYRVFQSLHFKSIAYDLVISIFYGLMSYAWIYWITQSEDYRIFFSLTWFLVGLLIIWIRNYKGLVSSLIFRMSISLAIVIWITWIRLAEIKDWKISQPQFIFLWNSSNIWKQIIEFSNRLNPWG